MPLLRVDPGSTIRTVPRLMEAARGLSRQALVLYADLAHRMAEVQNEPARGAFERIRTLLHESDIPEPGGDVRRPPPVFQAEELGSARLVTPYAAYSLAVRNQERAFAFWTHVSANAPDPEVQSEAERLARREIARVKGLRAARRGAYHASRPLTPSMEALRTASIEELKQQAGEMEAALATLHERIAARLGDGDPRSGTMTALAAEEREMAARLGASQGTEAPPEALPQGPEALVDLAIERLEVAVELYLVAAELSQREEVVSVAQELADRGIQRLSVLASRLKESSPARSVD